MKISSLEKGKVLHLPLDKISYNPSTHRFTDKALENHGIGHGTQLGGSPTFVADHMGQLLRAAPFNGIDDYIDCGNVLNTIFSGTNPWTISEWVKGSSGGTYSSPFSKGDNTVGLSIQQIDFGRIRGGDGGGNDFDIYLWDIHPSLADDTWHSITITYNGTNFISYVDGVYQKTNGWTYGMGDTSGETLRVGQIPIWSNTYFNGPISDVHIYNRALSTDEISLLYNSYRPKILL